MLNFIENPDIASIPQTNKEYYDECHYLDSSDLEQIVHPQALSPLQEEMMSYHCRLHHTPFLRLIVMAELGEISKQLAQLRNRCPSKLTHQRVNGSTIFVDHFSDHVYAYLMRDLTLDETIAAKHGYERFLHSHGIRSKAYHADNGRFADQGFRVDCLQNNQIITFCGVGSHHQNGIAETKIKDLTLCARTMLLHAKRMLPEYISTILWPFALKCAED